MGLGLDLKTSDGASSFNYEHRKDILEKSNLFEKLAFRSAQLPGVAVGAFTKTVGAIGGFFSRNKANNIIYKKNLSESIAKGLEEPYPSYADRGIGTAVDQPPVSSVRKNAIWGLNSTSIGPSSPSGPSNLTTQTVNITASSVHVSGPISHDSNSPTSGTKRGNLKGSGFSEEHESHVLREMLDEKDMQVSESKGSSEAQGDTVYRPARHTREQAKKDYESALKRNKLGAFTPSWQPSSWADIVKQSAQEKLKRGYDPKSDLNPEEQKSLGLPRHYSLPITASAYKEATLTSSALEADQLRKESVATVYSAAKSHNWMVRKGPSYREETNVPTGITEEAELNEALALKASVRGRRGRKGFVINPLTELAPHVQKAAQATGKYIGETYEDLKGDAAAIGKSLKDVGGMLTGGLGTAAKHTGELISSAGKTVGRAFGDAGNGIRKFLSSIFSGGNGNSGSGITSPSNFGGANAGSGGRKPNIANARGVTGGLRAAAMEFGLPAIGVGLATTVIEEFTGYEKRQSELQMRDHTTQGAAGRRQFEMEQTKEQIDHPGVLGNVLWNGNWGGGNSDRGNAKRRLQSQIINDITINNAIEDASKFNSRASQMESAQLEGAGHSQIERARAAIVKSERDKERARSDQWNKDYQSRGLNLGEEKKYADEQMAAQKKVDDYTISQERARLKEDQDRESKQFIGAQSISSQAITLRLAGKNREAEMTELSGSRDIGRLDVVKQFGDKSKEAAAYDENTNKLKEQLKLHQEIQRTQEEFNSSLKIELSNQEGISAVLEAQGKTYQAHHEQLIETENEKVKTAKQAYNEEIDVEKKALRKSELEAAQKHRLDMAQAETEQDIYQSSVMREQRQSGAVGYFNKQAGGVIGMMDSYKRKIIAAGENTRVARELGNEQAQILMQTHDQQAMSSYQRKENTYETNLRAAGADRAADLAHIRSEAAKSLRENQGAQNEVQKLLKDKNHQDPKMQAELKNQLNDLQDQRNDIQNRQKADERMAMAHSVSFSSGNQFWHDLQKGFSGKLNGPKIPGLPQPPNINDGAKHYGKGFIVPTVKLFDSDQKKEQSNQKFDQTVSKFSSMLDNSLKIGLVTF